MSTSSVRAKDVARDVFSRHADSYRSRSRDVLARGGDGGRLAALDALRLTPGQRVLDAACGPGMLTLDVLERVSPGGSVVATDLAAGMLGLARAEASRQGVRGVCFATVDMEALAFGRGSFDAVYCAHGLHFAPDLAAVLSEFARVLRPGGRVAASFPAMERRPDHPIRILDELVVQRLGPAPEMADTRTTRQVLDDADRLRPIAQACGFTGVAVERVEQSIPWPDAETLVARAMMCWWASASRLERLPGPERNELLRTAAARIRDEHGPGGLSVSEVSYVLTAEAVGAPEGG